MKYSKAEVHCKTHGLPALRFEGDLYKSLPNSPYPLIIRIYRHGVRF